MERELQRLNWKQVGELIPEKIDTVIFPVGTVEAHGAAALGTDNYIPVSMAQYLAEKINAIIAPVLNYGITKSLYGYPGSITIKPENYEKIISDILRSFRDIGFRQVIILNGHGGNNSSLKSAAQNFFYDYQVKIAVIHWWELCGDLARNFYGEAGGHAALDENALIQAYDPTLVDKSQFDENMTYFFRPGADIYPVPGTILLYTENEGMPDFNLNKSKEYQKLVFSEVEKFVKLILERWKNI